MITYNFIVAQNKIKYKIWSKTLFQYLKWSKDPDLVVNNLYLSKIKLEDNKISSGYYHEEIK